MNSISRKWLHEAKVDLNQVDLVFTQINSMTATQCSQLCLVPEKALKAVAAERYGSVPNKLKKHDLESLARSAGILQILPEKYQVLLRELNSFGQETRYPFERPYNTLVQTNSPQYWKERIATTGEFVKYIEENIIENPNIIGRP